jgi:hypothetical protein
MTTHPRHADTAKASPQPDHSTLILPPSPRSERPSVLESFTFLFQSEQWALILVLGGCCILLAGMIPIVPLMFFNGYVLFLVEQRIRRPHIKPFALNFDHASLYLERGVWPILAQVVLGLILMVPMTLCFVVLIAGGAVIAGGLADGDEQTAALLTILATGMGILLLMVLSILLYMFTSILWFRSGMAGTFKDAFQIKWAWKFIRLCGPSLSLGFLGLFFTSFVLNLVGLMLLFVGYYATTAWANIALFHYLSQWYEVFLSRGGAPIPLHPKLRLESLVISPPNSSPLDNQAAPAQPPENNPNEGQR